MKLATRMTAASLSLAETRAEPTHAAARRLKWMIAALAAAAGVHESPSAFRGSSLRVISLPTLRNAPIPNFVFILIPKRCAALLDAAAAPIDSGENDCAAASAIANGATIRLVR